MQHLVKKYEFNEDGVKTIAEVDGLNSNMLMDIDVYKLEEGGSIQLLDEEKETAFLLLSGKVTFRWNGREETASRADVFSEKPYALHVPRNTAVEVEADEETEILVQATVNAADFAPVYYKPEDCVLEHMGKIQWEGTAERLVLTVFDYNNAPYSNMVLGEVIGQPGRWSSYIPHMHDQPEVYYYKFSKPQGFGASFIGEDVFKIVDGSASCIPGGLDHPQVTAPGYRMYVCWMIRHLEGNPWTDRVMNPEHTWLLEQE